MVHVLVVEDDIRLNQIVCASLRSAGYDARGCTNAVEAFGCFPARSPGSEGTRLC